MKYPLLILLFLISITAQAQTPAFRWAKQLSRDMSVSATTTDGAGNFYMTGTFTGTVDFNPGPGIDTLTDAGFGDLFITKLDSAGNFLWAKRIGNSSYDEGKAIVTDATGNVYITGFFSTDSVDFDPGPNTFFMSAGENSFVLKLDANGNFVWAKQVTGTGENFGLSMVLDPQNNILISGRFDGTADFDPGAGTYNLTAFSSDIYFLKLDNNGNFIWARQIQALSTGTRSYGIGTDRSGNVYASGLLKGTTDFDPGTGVANLTNASTTQSTFILKLNAAGNFVWVRKVDNVDSYLSGTSLLVDAAGNSYIGGYFNGTVDFDPNAGVQNLTSATNNTCFLLKLDSSANFSWVKQLPDVKGMTADHAGNSYTCGSSIRKFGADGTAQWVSDSSLSTRIAVEPSGGIYMTGIFTGTFDFDPGTGVSTLITPAGDANVFVQKLKQQPVLAVSQTLVQGSSCRIYPNPNNGSFYVQATVAGKFLLVNELGQTVKEVMAVANKAVLIDAGSLPDGIYFIRDVQGRAAAGKIVMRH